MHPDQCGLPRFRLGRHDGMRTTRGNDDVANPVGEPHVHRTEPVITDGVLLRDYPGAVTEYLPPPAQHGVGSPWIAVQVPRPPPPAPPPTPPPPPPASPPAQPC